MSIVVIKNQKHPPLRVLLMSNTMLQARRESNSRKRFWRPLYYHYTTRPKTELAPSLFCFFVWSVLSATFTVLFHLEAFFEKLLILM